MEKEIYKNIEKRLYKYYEQKNLIEKLKNKVVLLYKQIEDIIDEKKNLKNLNIDIGLNMGIDYSKDIVQTSSDGTSEVERETVNYINELEKQQKSILRNIHKNNCKIREFQLNIQDMNFSIEMFNEELKRFIEFKYGEGKNMDWIANEMYSGSRTTCYRKKDEILQSIKLWNIIMK